ncbi:MAG: T9SS type A sorting domain-containing protein, partial [Bacteroidia bacterium]|nr:T9SS type A sorting domain-containing protein [Bacteroidia bacterium]
AEIKKFNCATDIADITSNGTQIILPEDDTKSVQQPATKEDFVIAPNPTEGLFTIDFTLEKNEKIFIQLFDINGNIVLTLPDLKRADTGYKIDIGNLTDGVYILKGYTSLGRLIIKKLIKF